MFLKIYGFRIDGVDMWKLLSGNSQHPAEKPFGGSVIEIAEIGGLHNRYEQRAA
jgi:hypothetical protein